MSIRRALLPSCGPGSDSRVWFRECATWLLAMTTAITGGCRLVEPPATSDQYVDNPSQEEWDDKTGAPWGVFPDSPSIEEIIAQPLPEDDDIFVAEGAEAAVWELEEPFLSVAGAVPYQGDNWGGAALAEHARRGGDPLRVTAAMTCLAREQGRFWLSYQEQPGPLLYDHLLARCGTTVSRAGASIRHWTVSPPGRRPSVESVRTLISNILTHEYQRLRSEFDSASVFGAWYDGDENGGDLYVVQGKRQLRLDPFDMNLSGRDHVVISGTRPDGTAAVEAISSTGSRATRCTPIRPTVQGPGRFSLQCPVLATDSAAMIDVIEVQKNRLLGSRVLSLFTSPDGTMPRVYTEAPSPMANALEATDATDPNRLVHVINTLRERRGLHPLALDPGQGEEMSRLLPHYVAATHDPAQAELADTIALAFMAARKAESLVRDADFLHFTSAISESTDIAKVLAQQCRSPMVRATLMDPEADSVAIGMHSSSSGDAAAFVVATYDHPDPSGYGEVEVDLRESLDAARARRSRSRSRRLTDAGTETAMDRAMAYISGGLDPRHSVEQAVELISRNYHRGFGYTFVPVANDPRSGVEWPMQMLDLDPVRVSMRVGYYRPPEGNWAYELAFIVYTDG